MEFTTKGNNVKVTINPASLDNAFRLKSVAEKAILKQGINLFDILGKGDITYEDVFGLAMAVDSAPEVFEACFACLDKSIYNGVKITKDVFEDEEARGDLYEVLFYCLKVNVYPFFKSLLSSFGTSVLGTGTGEDLKSI